MERMEREVVTIQKMIGLYCKSEHGTGELCSECAELDAYAQFRLSKCPFQEKKPACQKCKIHCYKPDMKEKVKVVMRKTGPKMLLHHPYLASMHVIDTFREAPKLPRRKR